MEKDGGMILTGETEKLGEKPILVQLCPQFSQGANPGFRRLPAEPWHGPQEREEHHSTSTHCLNDEVEARALFFCWGSGTTKRKLKFPNSTTF
jgi:hypothetical protein